MRCCLQLIGGPPSTFVLLAKRTPLPSEAAMDSTMAAEAVCGFRDVCFTPGDFFQDEVPFWKGCVVLVPNADIEDEHFWVEHSIALAISLDSGYLRDANNEHEGWIRYPFGRQGRNIPVLRAPASSMVERMRSCLPHVVGVLASGKNVALHCTSVAHEGKLGLMLLALALAPPTADEADPMQITRAIDWKWHEAFEMAGGVATGREP